MTATLAALPGSKPSTPPMKSRASGGGGPSSSCGCSNVAGGGASGAPADAGAGVAALTPPGLSEPASSYAPAAPKEHDAAPKPDGARKADASKWVSGDTKGLHADLLDKLAQLGEKMGEPVKINSGFRTRGEQEELYALYKAGKGNLAAAPGTSRHESGNAADASIGGTSLADNPKAKQIASELGLHFPVPGEAWHVEVK